MTVYEDYLAQREAADDDDGEDLTYDEYLEDMYERAELARGERERGY